MAQGETSREFVPPLDEDLRECGCGDGDACTECTDPSDWEPETT